MATTHYSELKVFALTTSYVENACCEFDVETLRPTYRLLIGIPGKSNAFAISSKLGLPDEIIASAREHISEEEESFEDLLTDLETSRRTIENERNEIQRYKAEIESLKKKLEQKQERIDAQKDKILREANEEARRILQEAKDVADETIRDFQKINVNKTSIQDLEKARTKVRDKITEKNAKLTTTQEKPTHKLLKPNQIKPGDLVKVVSMGLKGTISSKPDAKGDLFVQCGIIRSKVNIKDLVLINEDALSASASYKKNYGVTDSSKRTGGGSIGMSKTATLSTEINLLGKTVDEALSELDKYLDDAYLSHAPSVRIVHGKGTGALRQAVHQYLKRISYVKSFHLVVDDDENIAELISLYMTKECFETRIVYDGESALREVNSFAPDLILLDLMLPGIDGYQVCREVRQKSQTPIIMLSAKGEVFDKVLGLELGADDYLEKPFDTKELVARVKAVLRRYKTAAPAEPASDAKQVSYPNLTINLTNYSVIYNNKTVEMPPKELELLYFLAASPNHVYTREQLLDQIWGYEYIGDTRTVDVHIKRLREKIKDHETWRIATIWGVGYKFEVKD